MDNAFIRLFHVKREESGFQRMEKKNYRPVWLELNSDWGQVNSQRFLDVSVFSFPGKETALEEKSTDKREIGLNLNPALNLLTPWGVQILLHAQTLHVMARAEIVWILPPHPAVFSNKNSKRKHDESW